MVQQQTENFMAASSTSFSR